MKENPTRKYEISEEKLKKDPGILSTAYKPSEYPEYHQELKDAWEKELSRKVFGL